MHKLDTLTGALAGVMLAIVSVGYVQGIFNGGEAIAAVIGAAVVGIAMYKTKGE